MKMSASAFRTFFRHLTGNNHLAALITVVSRDSVSPPKLTGNTPVTDIFQPVKIGFAKACRNKFQLALIENVNSSFCHLVHTNEPLRLDHRLYRSAAAVMSSNAVGMGNYLHQKSLCLKICHHCLTRFITVHSRILAAKRIDGSVVIHDIDLRKVVTFSNLKVVRVMGRCDLHASCSKFFIHILVCHNRNFTVCERQLQHFSNQILISLVIRIYRYCSISQKCFRTGGGNLHKASLFSNDRIIDVPEKSVLILMLYLCIGNRSLAYRTPVDDPGAFVDIAFFIKLDKHFLNCLGAALVHGKAFSFPVCRCAELFQLVDDLSAVLFLPCPGMF